MNKKRSTLAFSLILLLAISALAQTQTSTAKRIQANAPSWIPYLQELEVNRLLKELSAKAPQTIAFEDVSLIPMTDDRIRPNQTVVIQDGRFQAIGSTGKVPIPPNALRVQGNGKYLMPGLTDMHVHSLVSNSQKLLNLSCGVTTVRDMCGFPWLLEERNRIAGNQILAPNLYVAGQILNYMPMDYYARVIKTPEEGRKAVQAQAKSGYDFIKIHNVMPLPIYLAVIEEAKKLHIYVVGHIPHEVKLEEAIQAGQQTLEHFKGYYYDTNLKITTEDYVSLTAKGQPWNCPTFYTYRADVTSQEANRLLALPEMLYAPRQDREAWKINAAARTGPTTGEIIQTNSRKIFKDLLPSHAKFLSGTDSGGGYDFMVPGFSLLEELETMQELGLSPYEVLQTSTWNAALAMGKEKEFGTIEVGKRADCILLSKNPMQDVKNLRSEKGVMVRGIWLPDKQLSQMLSDLADIYDSGIEILGPQPAETIKNFYSEYTKLCDAGFCGRKDAEEQLAKLLKDLN